MKQIVDRIQWKEPNEQDSNQRPESKTTAKADAPAVQDYPRPPQSQEQEGVSREQ